MAINKNKGILFAASVLALACGMLSSIKAQPLTRTENRLAGRSDEEVRSAIEGVIVTKNMTAIREIMVNEPRFYSLIATLPASTKISLIKILTNQLKASSLTNDVLGLKTIESALGSILEKDLNTLNNLTILGELEYIESHYVTDIWRQNNSGAALSIKVRKADLGDKMAAAEVAKKLLQKGDDVNGMKYYQLCNDQFLKASHTRTIPVLQETLEFINIFLLKGQLDEAKRIIKQYKTLYPAQYSVLTQAINESSELKPYAQMLLKK